VAIVSPPRTVQAEKELPETLLYTRAARDAAAELGVPLADVHGAFRADESARKSELYLDAVHPASKGHELYGTVVKRALDGEGVLPARLR
jgi:lysophospholipase L1-like esterase